MARWKKVASVDGEGPRAWLLGRREGQLRANVARTPDASTDEMVIHARARMLADRERLEQQIEDIKAGKAARVARWELPRGTTFPSEAHNFIVTADGTLIDWIPGAD